MDLAESLTRQFYNWEQRGRGWIYDPDILLDLEPPYHPFFHYAPQVQHTDDGKHHTLASWLIDSIKSAFQTKEDTQEPEDPGDELIPYPFDYQVPLRYFSLSNPKGQKIDTDAAEQLLLMLSDCQYPISFEIIGTAEKICLQVVCREPDALQVQSQLKAFFPNSSLKEKEDHISAALNTDGKYAAISHYALKDEFMRPLRTIDSFDKDPLTGILAALEQLEEGCTACIQVLFRGTQNPWSESIIRSVTDTEGKSFFANAPEMVALARDKTASPLFAVTIRILGIADTIGEAQDIIRNTGNAVGRLYSSDNNSLQPIYPEIDFQSNLDAIILRASHLLGMFLNSKELATLVHVPDGNIISDKLERDTRKTKQAPKITEGHELVLGINQHQGKQKEVSTSTSQRLRHTHIIGATGTGKSTLIQSMIVQDIQLGNGIAVLDPHGDLIENILPHIPEHRRKDVLIIDPADRDYPVGFNFFTAHNETEKDILSSDLVAVFKRLSTSWGDQMNSVLANAILAFLESTEGGTMIDLRRFLVEKNFRDNFLKTVNDPSIKYYWQKEYPLLKSNSIGSILTRLDTFLRPKLIRNMVAQKKSLDFERLLDDQKIILVKLSQGLIGNENSYLLGTVIVSKIHQAAMARQAKEERKDFFIYIDEFQNFITPSMSHILSGARKYHVGLVLAHQDMQQLIKHDTELASAVVSNAGTRICFRLGDTDAKRFDSGFSYFDARDLENLSTGQAICWIERPDYDFSLDTIPLPNVPHEEAERIMQEVINHSRQTYGTPKAEVEAQLNELASDAEPIQERKETRTKQTEPPKEPAEVKETPVPLVIPPIQPIPTPELTEEKLAATKEKLIQQKEATEHRSLQYRIKKMAEQRGYKATIEASTPDGKGKADVLLERNNKRIACEICVTTKTDWEVHNIQKNIEAGYELIVECSNDKKTLEALKEKVAAAFDTATQEKILILEPEALFQYMDSEIAKEAVTETKIKGYRVKVEYSTDTEGLEQKRKAISKTIMDAMNRNKKDAKE